MLMRGGGYENSDTVLAGQLTLGARYAVSTNMKVFVEGRLVKSKDAQIAFSDSSGDAEFRSRAVVIGLRTSF